MSHAQAVILIAGGFGTAMVVFTWLVLRVEERRHAAFLDERDGR